MDPPTAKAILEKAGRLVPMTFKLLTKAVSTGKAVEEGFIACWAGLADMPHGFFEQARCVLWPLAPTNEPFLHTTKSGSVFFTNAVPGDGLRTLSVQRKHRP